jgi:tetratricopeptide (TPR) repeat protein
MIEQQEIFNDNHVLSGNPFPGLRPFNIDESLLFFGRDGLSDTLLEKLQATRFVAVVGTSGSGKSSLVRAGLLPALLSGFMPHAGSGWHVALFRPINNPIRNLARALSECGIFDETSFGDHSLQLSEVEGMLRHCSLGLIKAARLGGMSSHQNLLIVVDQFEELYRFEPSSEIDHPKEEGSAFVKLLLEATRQTEVPIYVILTMRSDYLGDSARFWGLPEAINRGQFLIPRMDDDERREAIEGPIRVRNAKISWPLVNRLLNDAGDDPRQLPILQHALMRTWDYWEKHRSNGEPIALEHYDNKEVGGMDHALSIHADEAYLELADDQRFIAEKMFKRLTEKGAGKREGRLSATVKEIADIAGVPESGVVSVIETFRKEGCSFLMPPAPIPLTPATLVDISHESLIRGWARLREWVEEESDSAKIYGRIVDDALRYPKEKGLLTDAELHFALKWRAERKPNPAWAIRYRTELGKELESFAAQLTTAWSGIQPSEYEIAMKYLDLSKEKHDLLEARKERRRLKSLITVSVVAIVLLVLSLSMSLLWGNARRERHNAEVLRQRAEDSRKNAVAQEMLAKAASEEANRAKTTALEDRRNALEAKALANQKVIEAEKLRKTAETQALRGNLLEQGIQQALSGESPAAVKNFEAVKRMYLRNRDTNKVAFYEVLIGNAFIRGAQAEDNVEPESALPYFKAALKMAQQGTVKFKPSAFVDIGDRIADIFDFEDRVDSAALFYDYAVQKMGDDDKDFKAETLIKLGNLYNQSEPPRVERAVDSYRNAADLLAGNLAKQIEIFDQMGKTYSRAGRTLEARVAYEKAREAALKSKDPVAEGDALRQIGETYSSEQENDKALKYFADAREAYKREKSSDQSLAALAGSGIAFENSGRVYERTDKTRAISFYFEAMSLYRQAIRPPARSLKDLKAKQSARIHLDGLRNLGPAIKDPLPTSLDAVLQKTIDTTGIKSAVTQYYDLKRNHPKDYDFSEETLNRIGYVLLRRKKVDEAIEIFKLNVEAYPEGWNTYDSLGEGYMTAGNKELAIINYEKSLKLNPQNKLAVDALKKLKGQ